MKKLALFILLASIGQCLGSDLEQKLIAAGKPYDLSKTLVAIAIQESNLGQVKVNLQDPSCGVTMVHLKYFLKRYKIKDTSFNRNLACQRLIDNDDLAISESVVILNYWKSRLCGKWGCTSSQWMKVWSAYNSGNNYNGKQGKAYALKIKKIIKSLNLKNNKG